MADFHLRNVPLLSRVGADRSDQLRTDIDAAVAGWAEAAVLRVDGRGQVLIADGQVVLTSSAGLGDRPPADAVFLGRIDGGRHVWAVRGPLEAPPEATDSYVLDLRRAGTIFDDVSSQLVATAYALLNWHDNARFSPVDGSPTTQIRVGGPASIPSPGMRSSPDRPAVICLVHDGADRVVLARQTVWPDRMFSLLAGFVEAGSRSRRAWPARSPKRWV